MQIIELVYREKKDSKKPMNLQGSRKIMIFAQSNINKTNKFVKSLQKQLKLLNGNQIAGKL